MQMNNRIFSDNSFWTELVSTMLLLAAEAVFLIWIYVQSSGNIFYRVFTRKGEESFYHVEYTNILLTLAAGVAVLCLITLVIALISWRKRINIMRLVIPVQFLMFSGIVLQAVLSPTSLVKHLITLLISVGGGVFGMTIVNLSAEKNMFRVCCAALIPTTLFCLVWGCTHMINGNGTFVLGVQPVELGKILLLLLAVVGFDIMRTDKKSRRIFTITAAIMIVSTFMARDIGNALIISAIGAFVLISLGQWKPVLGVGIAGAAAVFPFYKWLQTYHNEGTLYARFCQAGWYPVTHHTDSAANNNLRQCILALVRGGVLGTGTAEGRTYYVSSIFASETDFTWICGTAIFGAVFGLVILSALAFLVFSATRGNRETKAGHLKLYQGNILVTALLAQAIVHVLGSLTLIPSTGVTFPFLSAGGSAILSYGTVVGCILGLQLPLKARRVIASRGPLAWVLRKSGGFLITIASQIRKLTSILWQQLSGCCRMLMKEVLSHV